MTFYLNENSSNTLGEINNQEFFDNFHTYFEIKFESEASSSTIKASSIARNLKKEFDHHVSMSENQGASTDPVQKTQNLKNHKGLFHNFFCFCFTCQTKKYVQRKRSNSIKLSNPNRNIQLTKENKAPNLIENPQIKTQRDDNRISIGIKKNFILKNGKQLKVK